MTLMDGTTPTIILVMTTIFMHEAIIGVSMAGQDFNQSNCILNLNIKNNSFQYILQIPIDNYLIYFTN